MHLKTSNLTVKPRPLQPQLVLADVYADSCCVAEEHPNHVERLAPQISPIFLFPAPWHCWPARPPAAVMFADAEVKHGRTDLCGKCQHMSELASRGHLHYFSFLRDVGWLSPPPQHQHLVRLHCVSGQTMKHSWITTTGRGEGGGC